MFREKFGKSSVPKNEHPSEEELERARKAYEEADPTTYSQLATESLVRTGTGTYSDGADTYHKLPARSYFLNQQVAARLVKGVVPVADVVSGADGTLYSKELPHDRIKQSGTHAEAEANRLVLALLLHDADHSLELPTDARGHTVPQNAKVGQGAIAFYDLELSDLESRAHRNLAPESSSQIKSILRDKLLALQTQYEGEDGKVLFSAIVAADQSLNPNDAYRLFMDRIGHAIQEASRT